MALEIGGSSGNPAFALLDNVITSAVGHAARCTDLTVENSYYDAEFYIISYLHTSKDGRIVRSSHSMSSMELAQALLKEIFFLLEKGR